MTIGEKWTSCHGNSTGFDYLRLSLSFAVLVWHSVWLSTGSVGIDQGLWSGPFRFVPAAILPLFFALSGFLVTSSLLRTTANQFVALRIIRLVPALAVEVALSAFLLGTMFTTLSLRDYFSSPLLAKYFLNIVGYVHYELPGVFIDNIGGRQVNGQLWTIPYELECYVSVIFLAFVGLVSRPIILALTSGLLSLGATIYAVLGHPIAATVHLPGRCLVLCFLAAVCLNLLKGRIIYSDRLGVFSGLLMATLLQHPNLSYLSAFPAAYFTVWLGMKQPPKIPFGDLSYGVFLFHFPLEQTIMHLLPSVRQWWLLSLLTIPIVLLFAWLSWTLVEGPILRNKRTFLNYVDRFSATISRRKGSSMSATQVSAPEA